VARVFVTGGSGFVGAHLLRALDARGDQITCASRTPPVLDGGHPPIEWIRADLHDTAAYARALSTAHYVIHLAGLLAARRRKDYIRTNVDGTRALIDTCRPAGERIHCFVYMSSIAAMGPAEDGALLSEDSPCQPRTEYGASKLRAEQVFREAPVPWPVVILRPSFVYGIGDERGVTFLRELLGPRPSASRLTVHTISFCHVSDVVRACLLALEAGTIGVRTYLIAEPKTYVWSDIDAIVERALRRLAASRDAPAGTLAARLLEDLHEVQRYASPARDAERWGCDTSTAARELGFRTTRSLDEAAEEVIRFYLENGKLTWPRARTVVREA